MKKLLLTGLAIGALFMVDTNSINIATNDMTTDEYIMNRYITEEHGSECYGTLLESNYEDIIEFRICEDDGSSWYTAIDRDYYTSKYND